MNEVTAKLVSTAWELARIQLEGVKDFVGFSNADKNVGAHLASVVEADPTDEDAVRRLAALVGVKYQRQVSGMPGMERYLADFKQLAKGTKLTQEDRLAARMTMVAQPDVHPRFGARVLFTFQFNQDFAYILKEHGGRAFHGPDGFKWAVPMTRLNACVAKLKAAGAKIVGSLDVSDVAPEQIQVSTTRIIDARLDGKYVFLTFQYDRQLVDAVKEIPGRKYFSEPSPAWRIPATDLAQAAEHLQRVGDVDVSALVALADQVPHLARPVDAEEPAVSLEGRIPAIAVKEQREGIAWLTRPLSEVRKTTVGGSSIRGYILGDKPGVGKTMQAAVAARAVIDANGGTRIVVITPGNHKVGWGREIKACCGQDQTVQVLNGDSVIDSTVTWIVVNYDILPRHYARLSAMGFDVLIVDEAHYAKNHDAERSRLVAGGSKKEAITLSDAQKKTITAQFEEAAVKKGVPVDKRALSKALHPKKVIRVEGLASAARLRVFPLTGTILDNRPKDLFNQIRMVGHPLGRNFRDFALRYCSPTYKKVGNRLYTEYEGKSNLAELRERLDPIFLQRDAKFGGKLFREWTACELDLDAYREVMAEYQARRAAKELKTTNDHLAYYNEARRCAALAMVPNTIQSVESVLEADEKCIVFSYYTDVIDKIKAHFGDDAVVIDGRVSNNVKKDGSSKRQDAMDKFQNDPKCKVLVGQLTAAGVAVTLTAANYVKFNDMDWKPGTHFQCERRAYRRGQTRDVFVEYMVAAGTFYEEMATMLEEKLNDQNEFEGTNEVLFEKLIERLNTSAPKNEGVRKLMEQREKGMSRAAA